jgi:hypothetical protein
MIQLKKSDIGGEIISILTRGMYSDPRDALREYVQNGVDAKANKITIKIRQQNITIDDDGVGMDSPTMRSAIRLGVSDKNPKTNVGFMGIGIYSSFHLCDKLVIYSRTKSETPNKLTFNFKDMRDVLEIQKESRLNNELGDDKTLALQSLLEANIDLKPLKDEEFNRIGTRIEMIDLEDNFFKTLSKFDEVANYLEQVVPLPFNPAFKWGKSIEKKIQDTCKKHNATFELINLELQINDEIAELFRPYTNNVFEPDSLEPIYKELKEGKVFFGIAWGCLNASRNTIKEKELRGFLFKKQGFSLGTRNDLLKYFKRQTFFNRYVGEIVIVHPRLLPNAPRSDFEFSPLRISLYGCLAEMATFFNEKANTYQEISKTDQEINIAIDYIKSTRAQLEAIEDNSDQLLNVLWKLTEHNDSLQRRLNHEFIKTQRGKDLDPVLFELKKLVNEIKQILEARRKRFKPKSTPTATQLRDLKRLPNKKDTINELIPDCVNGIIDSLGVDVSDEIRMIIQLIDEQYIQPTSESKEQYQQKILDLKQQIEELIEE